MALGRKYDRDFNDRTIHALLKFAENYTGIWRRKVDAKVLTPEAAAEYAAKASSFGSANALAGCRLRGSASSRKDQTRKAEAEQCERAGLGHVDLMSEEAKAIKCVAVLRGVPVEIEETGV